MSNTRFRRCARVIDARRSASVGSSPCPVAARWPPLPHLAGITRARYLLLGAKTPWNPVRLTRGFGARAARRATKSSSVMCKPSHPWRDAVLRPSPGPTLRGRAFAALRTDVCSPRPRLTHRGSGSSAGSARSRDVEVERAAKALNQDDRAGLSRLAREPSLLDQMGGDTALDNAQHLAHDGGAIARTLASFLMVHTWADSRAGDRLACDPYRAHQNKASFNRPIISCPWVDWT